MLLLIDNYDSFTHNLARYFRELGQDVLVKRNDALSLKDIKALKPQYIVISPGPKKPENSGISIEVIRAFAGNIPILGVCLGHQCLGYALGGTVKKAISPVHGKVSLISHNRSGFFTGVVYPLQVMRYHSLIIDRLSLPSCLSITSETVEGEIMSIVHKNLPLVGVQFHPESVLTQEGHLLLHNFLKGLYR